MYCKECGNQIADDFKFCPSCGKLQGRESISYQSKSKSTAELIKQNEVTETDTSAKSNIHNYIIP